MLEALIGGRVHQPLSGEILLIGSADAFPGAEGNTVSGANASHSTRSFMGACTEAPIERCRRAGGISPRRTVGNDRSAARAWRIRSSRPRWRRFLGPSMRRSFWVSATGFGRALAGRHRPVKLTSMKRESLQPALSRCRELRRTGDGRIPTHLVDKCEARQLGNDVELAANLEAYKAKVAALERIDHGTGVREKTELQLRRHRSILPCVVNGPEGFPSGEDVNRGLSLARGT